MTTRQRLFAMMVLEFFIWGAWLPLIFGYLPSLGFGPGQQSLILSAFRWPLSSACSSATSGPTARSRPNGCWRRPI
jgi:hypothetical protein